MAELLTKEMKQDLINISSNDLQEVISPILSDVNKWLNKYKNYVKEIKKQEILNNSIINTENAFDTLNTNITEERKREIIMKLRESLRKTKVESADSIKFIEIAQEGVFLLERIREKLTGQKIIYVIASSGLTNLQGNISDQKVFDKIAFNEGEDYLKQTKLKSVASQNVSLTGNIEKIISKTMTLGVAGIQEAKKNEQEKMNTEEIKKIQNAFDTYIGRSVTVFLKTYNQPDKYSEVASLNKGQLFEAMLKGAVNLSLHTTTPSYGPWVTQISQQIKQNTLAFYKGSDIILKGEQGELIYLQAKVGNKASISIQTTYNALKELQKILEAPDASEIVNFFFETKLDRPIQTAYDKVYKEGVQQGINHFISLVNNLKNLDKSKKL